MCREEIEYDIEIDKEGGYYCPIINENCYDQSKCETCREYIQYNGFYKHEEEMKRDSRWIIKSCSRFEAYDGRKYTRSICCNCKYQDVHTWKCEHPSIKKWES